MVKAICSTNQATYSWTLLRRPAVVAAYGVRREAGGDGDRSDTGLSVSDGVTSDQTLVVSGTAGKQQHGHGPAERDEHGKTTATGRSLELRLQGHQPCRRGRYNFTARNAAGNVSPGVQLVIDTRAGPRRQ